MSTNPNRAFRRRFQNRRRGAALVEFAFISVLFLTIVLGMLQLGIYLNATNSLWNLSREGARFAAVQATGSPTANAEIEAHVRGIIPPTLDNNDLGIEILPANSSLRTSRTQVTVRLTYDMHKKIFLIPSANQKPSDEEKKLDKVYIAPLGRNYVTTSSMMVE